MKLYNVFPCHFLPHLLYMKKMKIHTYLLYSYFTVCCIVYCHVPEYQCIDISKRLFKIVVFVVKCTSLVLQLQASVTNYMCVNNYYHYDLSAVITQYTYIRNTKHSLPSSVTTAVSLIISGIVHFSANLKSIRMGIIV
jgi:hypothetical protein